MTKKPIFQDPVLQEKYLQQGYVIIPVLNEEEVKDMLQLHYDTHPAETESPNCYNTSDHVLSIDEKRRIKNVIDKTLKPLFSEHLNGFKAIYVNFIGKKPGENSNRDLHQDYSFCDERVYDGYNIWIPLQDITEENSFFSIVRNSYRFFHSYRGRYIRHRFEKCSDQITDQFCTNIYPKAGHALIYNTGSLHYTPNNISDATRIAISVMTIPIESQISLYQSCEKLDDNVERYEVDEDFLLEYPAWKRIEGLSPNEIISYDNSDLTWKEFENAYYQFNKDVKRPGFWKKLFQKI